MNNQVLTFTRPGEIEIRRENLPDLQMDQVLVKAHTSAISAGTEMLIYRDLVPHDLPVDESIPGMQETFAYPLQYGYSLVGEVIERGGNVDPDWVGKQVFCFSPHQGYLAASPEKLIPIPASVSLDDAVFLPNMETAVNLVMDGAPMIGERALVFGQGIVGLLTTALLARFPLESVTAIDRFPLRLEAARQAGASAALQADKPEEIQSTLPEGADLCFELSGAPQALDSAIQHTMYSGRIVIGSWYGLKRAKINLGGRFHRSRIRMISSQVSTLAPEHSGRWSKARRFRTTWEMLRIVQPSRWISQRYPIERAAEAYRLLDENPGEALQILLTYSANTQEV
jgi:2-desacetyl-2-hydroxyethyl bacteriochlorophyllide A dehydrogenase